MEANVDRYDDFLCTLCGPSSRTWTDVQESALLEPYTYITANPGKEILSKLVNGFNLWLNVPEDKLAVINRVVSLLHNASLLVDDIEDDSQLRRGIPVAHKIYGVPQTLNTANYVYFLAYQELSTLRPTIQRRATSASPASGLEDDRPAAEKPDFARRIISDHDLGLVVNEDEYVEMVKDKTGGLLRITVKLLMACATTNTNIDYIPLINLIGIYYQIRDDYMNLQSNQYADNKGFAEDLSEGKFSFPIVHGILEKPENRQIMNVLQKRPKSPTLKHHTISYLKDTTKSFDYTLAVLKKLDRQARGELERLSGNPMLSAILDKLRVDALVLCS
ncbi:hypothetical protein AZE42_09305 [Rhizopogon vesiculosus]|uniref:(2E,6E)-farnesyl diphosphate synthase n=1 Tax=Rhizopogon vesiculosus TaxID=180088 RepID=A0A1J8R2S8_9AGAM|nr:hypothetical protein AZE42_09305 [Rhizopogon vesiculosus]